MSNIYESTRNKGINASASLAVLKGIAEDGGLFVLRDLDAHINVEDLSGKNYLEIAEIVFEIMLGDFSSDKIKECVRKAYTNKFSNSEITPIVKVGDSFIAELFHGPTAAFKDVALSILPHFLSVSKEINHVDSEVLILTATSGDTGKAALEGFKDVNGTNIVVFYPQEGVSEVQKMQMCTQEGSNTHVCAIRGNFDDAQAGVKGIFANEALIKELRHKNIIISSANSINVGRLVPQIVYYFYAYMKLVEMGEIEIWDKVNFSVPTGNFGNILAGYYAKCLGLPVNKLLCGSNENNVLYDFINTGIYDKNRMFYKTISPSMDILVSSNLERLLYYVCGKNNDEVNKLMMELKEKGTYKISADMMKKIQKEFYAGCVFEDEAKKTIKHVYEKYNYVMDTHTAVAYKTMSMYKREENDDAVCIVLSTASPYKFSKSVYESLYGETDMNEFEIMEMLSERTNVSIPDGLKGLNKKNVCHTAVCGADEMENYIRGVL